MANNDSNQEILEQDKGSESQQKSRLMKEPHSAPNSMNASNNISVRSSDLSTAQGVSEISKIDEEARIYAEKARSLMQNCLAQAAFKDLDHAIHLLRQVIKDQPFRVNALETLAHALCIRCAYKSQPIDLQESLDLYLKVNHNPPAEDPTPLVDVNHEYTDTLVEIAIKSLSNFTSSISSNSLDIIYSYLQTSLAVLRPREFPEHLWALHHLALAVYSRFQQSKSIDDLDNVILCLQRGFRCENGNPEHPRMRQLLGIVMIERYASLGDPSDLEKASNLLKNDSDITSVVFVVDNPPKEVETFHNLLKRIKDATLPDYDQAIHDLRQTILRMPVDHDDFPISLISLAALLISQSKGGSVGHYIDQAIILNKRALPLLPAEHNSRSSVILNLVVALQIRSEQKRQRHDLDYAILLLKNSLACIGTSQLDQPRFFHSLAVSLEMLFEHTDELACLDEAIVAYRQAIQCLDQSDEKRPTFVNDLATALQTRFRQVGERGDMEEVVLLRQESIELLPHFPFDPDRLALLVRLVAALQTLFRQTRKLEDLDKVISNLRSIIDYLPAFHEMRGEVTFHLADSLASRYQMTQQQEDLEEEILNHRKFLRLSGADDPNIPKCLNNLGCALSSRFHLSNQKKDLDEAIYSHRKALKHCPPLHPDRLSSLINLANSLERRFQHSGQRADLDEAISLNRIAESVENAPQSTRATVLNNLANALETLFAQTGHMEDLNQSIMLHRKALELRPKSDPDHASSLNNLGHVLHTRFKHNGQITDLDAAIQIQKDSLELHPPTHPNRPYSLDNLATALTERFQNTGISTDLEEAVLLHREALKLRTTSQFDRSLSLNNLAYTLQARFEVTSEQENLEEAIALHKAALELRSGNHPSRHMSLNNLANALMTLFDQVGRLDDLNEAIELHKQALERRAAPHPDRASSLMNLAGALGTHFTQTGQRRSLDEAIICYREALLIFPKSHPLRPMCLNNLANRLISSRSSEIFGQQDNIVEEVISLVAEALKLRSPPHPDWSLSVFHLSGLLEAQGENLPTVDQYNLLNKSVILCKSAIDLLPDQHVHRQAYVGRLAGLLNARFKISRQIEDIDKAILLQRQELLSQGPSHPDRVIFLTNLAGALQARFYYGADHNASDFQESVALNRQALDIYPFQHPGRFTCWANLGKVFHQAYTILGNPLHLEESLSSFALAMECPSRRPTSSFDTATLWSEIADKSHHDSALMAYSMALRCLTEMASFSLDVFKRQNILRSVSDGLARKAAQSAISRAHLDQAVMLLEEGRGVFWSQILRLRSPLDKLQIKAPELADKLKTVASELERGSYRSNVNIPDFESKISLEREASRFRRLDEDWRNCVEQARNLEGFEDFLKTPGLASLKAAALNTPIVFLLPNEQHSDCLILTSSGIHHLSLKDVSLKILRNLVDLVDYNAMRTTASRSLSNQTGVETSVEEVLNTVAEELDITRDRSAGAFSRRPRRTRPSPNAIFAYVLKILWFDVVKPVIDFLGFQKSDVDDLPILQWCPTGIFTFLPLHAAGCYNIDGTSNECASDFIISSYTPTATLLLPQEEPPLSNQPFKMLAVIDDGLPFAREELAKIRSQTSSDPESMVELGVANKPATIETICSILQTASIAHFACHGIQDQSSPLDSALLVGDGRLSLSKVMQFQPQNVSIAFLCACETGMGDSIIPDEAMSLGASLLFSGYRSVVATMWKMTDEDGPVISEAFYEYLFRGADGARASRPNIRKSARALHTAALKLRLSGVEFRRWVPFIHLGKGD
uniref:CHAT domain-containing protein n=1 Tax=Psilocybe cubensis TaxID=181762 RepID=A0A8H7Y5V6_PSICU